MNFLKGITTVIKFLPALNPALQIATIALPYVKLVAQKTENKTDDELVEWLETTGLSGADIILNGTIEQRKELFKNAAKSLLLRFNKNLYMEHKDNIIDSGVQLAYSIYKAKQDADERTSNPR